VNKVHLDTILIVTTTYLKITDYKRYIQIIYVKTTFFRTMEIQEVRWLDHSGLLYVEE